MYKNKTDEEIVFLTLTDSENFLYLMERYEYKLLPYIRRILSVDLEDAEDILQEVFIKAYENLNDFDPNLKFSSWIYRITYNHAITFYRKRKNAMNDLSIEDSEFLTNKIRSEIDVAENVNKKITSEFVRNILSQLSSKYKDVLILRFLEDKDYKEISNILKKPEGTIATLLNRAKNKFKQLLNLNQYNQ